MSAPSTERVRVTAKNVRQSSPDTPPSSKDGVSGCPGLKNLLDDYTERGTTRGFPEWARSMGWRVVRRRGYWLAYNGEHLAAFAVATVRGAASRQLSRIPCATCEILPTGEYSTGRTVDERRRYGCVHAPIEPGAPA